MPLRGKSVEVALPATYALSLASKAMAPAASKSNAKSSLQRVVPNPAPMMNWTDAAQ
jgi:hypothetical protein